MHTMAQHTLNTSVWNLLDVPHPAPTLAEIREGILECLRVGDSAVEGLLHIVALRANDHHGNFSQSKLNPFQAPAYTLAWLYAELQATRITLMQPKASEAAIALGAFYARTVLARLMADLQVVQAQLHGASAACEAYYSDNHVSKMLCYLHSPQFLGSAWDLSQAALEDDLSNGGLDLEQELVRGTFRQFAEQKIAPIAEKTHCEDALIPDALIKEAAALGCFGLSIPAAYGGIQKKPDSLGMLLVTEELSRASLIFGSLITRPEILAKAIIKGGDQSQMARFLPGLASGKTMAAIAVTEPDAGSDVGSIRLMAKAVDQGWEITGTKLWTTFAGRAELVGVLARTQEGAALKHRGLSLFVAEKPAFYTENFCYQNPQGGSMRGRAIATIGYRGMHSYELEFDHFFVPENNLIGGANGQGQGFALQMEGFVHGRLQTAGRALGIMQAAVNMANAHSVQRKVFGTALNALGLTRHALLGMRAALHANRQAAYSAARLLNEGGGRMEASMVKLLCCRNAEIICRNTQQLHGGLGYAQECAASRLFVDSRVLSIFEGAEEVLALRVIIPELVSPYIPQHAHN